MAKNITLAHPIFFCPFQIPLLFPNHALGIEGRCGEIPLGLPQRVATAPECQRTKPPARPPTISSHWELSLSTVSRYSMSSCDVPALWEFGDAGGATPSPWYEGMMNSNGGMNHHKNKKKPKILTYRGQTVEPMRNRGHKNLSFPVNLGNFQLWVDYRKPQFWFAFGNQPCHRVQKTSILQLNGVWSIALIEQNSILNRTFDMQGAF